MNERRTEHDFDAIRLLAEQAAPLFVNVGTLE
jgi:hypothetical protein